MLVRLFCFFYEIYRKKSPILFASSIICSMFVLYKYYNVLLL